MYKHVLDIKPTHTTSYPVYLLDRKQSLFKRPPIRTGTRGLSSESRKVLMTAINWLVLFSPEQQFFCDKRKRWIKFRINFITLTLAGNQEMDDDYMKARLLQPFLKWIIRKGATAYIWKAETQNNGNIHFHITTNIYIHWRDIRDKWNELQRNHAMLNGYEELYGNDDPNSTDVHSVHKYADMVNNIGSYFGKIDEWCHRKGTRIQKENINHPSKWLSQCDQDKQKFPVPKRQVNGRKWAVSNNLVGIKCCVDDESLRATEFEEVYTHFLVTTPHKTLVRDFADIYIYNEQELFTNMHPVILDRLSGLYDKFVKSAPKA